MSKFRSMSTIAIDGNVFSSSRNLTEIPERILHI